MPFVRVLEATPTTHATRRLQAYRYQHFSRPIVCEPDRNGSVEQRAMAAEEAADPVSFRVESRGQFVDGVNIYFEPEMVGNVFEPFWNGRQLEEQEHGSLHIDYHIHCDPALVNDFFSMMVCHAETAPKPDEFGIRYKHLMVDFYKVWKPTDFAEGRMDYLAICNELKQYVKLFRPTSLTMDQWNSAYMIQELQQYATDNQIRCSCSEFTASQSRNFQMYEALKFSINTGLVHSYVDRSWRDEQGRSMLQAMLEQVQLVKGKIDKPRSQELGHLDLCDCLAVLCLQLIGDQRGLRRDMLTNNAAVSDSDIFANRVSMNTLARSTHANSPLKGYANDIAKYFGR